MVEKISESNFQQNCLVFLAFFYKERHLNYYIKVRLHISQLIRINWNDLEVIKICAIYG